MKSFSLLALAAIASADAVVWPRTVSALDEVAAAQAQQRDDTATRALSNTHIKVCLTSAHYYMISRLTYITIDLRRQVSVGRQAVW